MARISSLLEGSTRPLHIGTSHASLLQHYAAKSDTGKTAQLNVDTSRVHFPGDNLALNITLDANVFSDLEAVEVEFRGEVHTFGFSTLGGSSAGASGGGQAQIQSEKQVFLSCSAKMQLPSMQSEASEGPISISQRSKEEPMQLDVVTRLPSYLKGKEAGKRLALPPVFHDGTTGKPAAFITYHWKVTTHRKSSFKGAERLWKPVMVMPLPLDRPNPDTFLPQATSYPPHHLMKSYGAYREVKKFMVKTAALMEFEIALPSMDSWPMFRPVPVVVRLSVRAKTPSDLLEPRQFTLPSLPTQQGIPPADQAGAIPLFYIRRSRSSQVYMSTSEISKERSHCKCLWDGGHLNNGFTQQNNGKGFEGGREGSTPIADQRAQAGFAHGWTWPARSDPRTESTFFSTPIAPFRKEALKSLLPGSSPVPSTEMLQSYEYVSTCTLFGKVFLAAHPSVKVNNLIVSNELGFAWSMEGARNKIDATLSSVDVNLALNARQAATVTQEDLIKAITAPEELGDQSLLYHMQDDQPPSLLPPPFAGHERPPRYTGS